MMKVLIMGAPTSDGYRAFGKSNAISGGSWVENLIRHLMEKSDKTLQLGVCFYENFTDSLAVRRYQGVCYYALPIRVKGLTSCNEEMRLDIQKMINDFAPDVTHIIGTEREHNKVMFDLVGPEKSLISITGLASMVATHYYSGIDERYLRRLSIGDIIRRGGPIKDKKRFIRWGKTERTLLSSAKYVTGRTTWDYACVSQINSNIEYTHCGEILNSIYKDNKWDIKNIKKYRIFVSQATYPIKGFHKLLEAFSVILQIFPDSEIVVAGADILDESTVMSVIKRTTYAKYLLRLIKKLGIPREKIKYIGPLDAEGMLAQYLSAHVFVLPSAIENSPNSLGEAMSLGMPCVASCVGGVQDMLRDKIDGFIYPFDEPYMLAHYVCEIFKSDDVACKIGDSAAIQSHHFFDADKVVETTMGLYKKVASS